MVVRFFDVGGRTNANLNCSFFEGKAALGEAIDLVPSGTGEYNYPFTEQEVPRVPRGRHIVYVLTFANDQANSPPLSEGCNERFDTDGSGDETKNAAVALKVVIPKDTRLQKIEGDNQVGRPGTELSSVVRIEAVSNAPSNRAVYRVPGVAVNFRSTLNGVEFIGPDDVGRETLEVVTGTDGEAEVRVRLPQQAGTGEITVRAAEIESAGGTGALGFAVAIPPPIRMVSSKTLQVPGVFRPLSLSVGSVTGGSGLDAVVLGCEGTEENCTVGRDAVPSFGRTTLAVVRDLNEVPEAASIVLPPEGLGILPAGLALGEVLPENGEARAEIAVVNSRQASCQDRVCQENADCACHTPQGPSRRCPCENAEIVVLRGSGDEVQFVSRHAMTANNAVGVAPFRYLDRSFEDPIRTGFAIAGQGRSKAVYNQRPCSSARRCLSTLQPVCETSLRECGCPAGEKCENGFCEARDTMVDLLVVDSAQLMFENRGGCQEVVDYFCQGPDVMSGACREAPEGSTLWLCKRCKDDPRRQSTMPDGCGMCVPRSIRVGALDSVIIPKSITAGFLSEGTEDDFFVSTLSGFGFVKSRGGFRWDWNEFQPTVNAQIDIAVVANLDSREDSKADLVWAFEGGCTQGSAFDNCPVVSSVPEGEAKGCVGVYRSNNASSLVAANFPSGGGCQRYELAFRPQSLCTGLLNADDYEDVAVGSQDMGAIAVMSGDGRGGLLDPPEFVDLPGDGVAGPVACPDIDGDGADDLVTFDGSDGVLHVFRQER